MPDIKFTKLLVFVNSAVPGALLVWDAWHHRLGANPQEFVLHTTGTLALVFLCISLALGLDVPILPYEENRKQDREYQDREVCDEHRLQALVSSMRLVERSIIAGSCGLRSQARRGPGD